MSLTSTQTSYRFSPHLILIGIVLLPAIGCAPVGPDYKRPETTISQSRQYEDPAFKPQSHLTVQWWTLLDDPLLNQLIEEAGQGNLDLKAAVARLDEAQAQLGVVRGERLPRVGAEAGVTRGGLSENALSFGGTYTSYSISVPLSWEIDLFGRIRRSIEAAEATLQAGEEDYRDVMISLQAEVARTYYEIRTLQIRLKATQAKIESQKEIVELTRARARHGIGTELEVAQSERQLAEFQTLSPTLRLNLVQARNALAVLMGRQPGEMEVFAELDKPVDSIVLPAEQMVVGIPSDLLRQRPDIRAAERRLAAQTARVGIATADLYPSFSISALLGREALDVGDLFKSGAEVWRLGVSLGQTLFDGGRIRARIDVEDARTRQALHGYEKTVLVALSEVENAMAAYVENRNTIASLERSAKAAEKALELARVLYREGLGDFLNVLDAQSQLFDLDDRLAVAKGDSAATFVGLYRALGGGWDPENPVQAARHNSDSNATPALPAEL